jgi:hypothetical protein
LQFYSGPTIPIVNGGTRIFQQWSDVKASLNGANNVIHASSVGSVPTAIYSQIIQLETLGLMTSENVDQCDIYAELIPPICLYFFVKNGKTQMKLLLTILKI